MVNSYKFLMKLRNEKYKTQRGKFFTYNLFTGILCMDNTCEYVLDDNHSSRILLVHRNVFQGKVSFCYFYFVSIYTHCCRDCDISFLSLP